ncbi:MAG: hypothetical protein ABF318_14445, partial [Ketobacter sp.]
MNIRTVWTLVAMLLAGHVSPCRAALVENLTMGNAKALALGNAVTADPPGVDAIHFNPAGLTRLKGRQYNLKVLAASFGFTVEFGGYDDITQQLVDNNGYNDEAAYSTSETTTIGLRIPFVEGITEWPLPVLFLPLQKEFKHIPSQVNIQLVMSARKFTILIQSIKV